MINLDFLFFLPEISVLALATLAFSWGSRNQIEAEEEQNFLLRYPRYVVPVLFIIPLVGAFYIFSSPGQWKPTYFMPPYLKISSQVLLAKMFIFSMGYGWLGFKFRVIRRSLQRDGYYSFEYNFFSALYLFTCMLLLHASDFLLILLLFSLLHLVSMLMIYREPVIQERKKELFFYILYNLLTYTMLALGVTFIYAGVGALDFATITQAMKEASFAGAPFNHASVLGILCFIFYILSHLKIFPFSLFDGSSIELFPKAGQPLVFVKNFSILFVLAATLLECFSSFIDKWSIILFYSGLAAIIWASITALFQEDISKFLFSINQFISGIFLILISIGTLSAFNSALFFIITYLTAAVALVYFLTNISRNDQNISSFHHLRGLSHKHPALSIIIAICFLTLATVPPFSGFWTTLYALKELIDKGWIFVMIILVAVVMSSFQFFHVMRQLYLSANHADTDLTENWRNVWLAVPLYFTLFFLFHKFIFRFIQQMTFSSWSI